MTEKLTSADATIRMAKLVRKDLLPYGAQRQIARRLGCEEKDVSLVMNDQAEGAVAPDRIRKIRVAIARKLRMSVAEAFPETVSTGLDL